MICEKFCDCGGCKYRDLSEEQYRRLKEENFSKALNGLKTSSYQLNAPVFIADGCRRRVTFAFSYKKKNLVLGFNREASSDIVDIDVCPLAEDRINKILPALKEFMKELCAEAVVERQGKKIITKTISGGDVFICAADNGLDIVLEFKIPPTVAHRMIISDFCNGQNDVIRLSHRFSADDEAETIVEKTKPYVKMGAYHVYIPAGTFLQPSKQGQQALGDLVLHYTKGITGTVADLFCGVGTFSYLLASAPDIKIVAADSSKALLKGFQNSVHQNQIQNISIINKNLFKYPFQDDELKDFAAVIFDPPRAGAKALCRAIADAPHKPAVVVAVSCNPQTFVNDANVLIEGGYTLREITMVDQFIYSNHSELVAFFTK